MKANYKPATTAFALCAATLSLAGLQAATVAVPYSNSFSAGAGDFVNNGTWAVVSEKFQNTIGAADVPTSSSVNAPSLQGQSFSLSSSFTIDSLTGTSGTVGLGALGTTSDLRGGGSTNSSLLADISMTGGLRFVTLGATTGFYNAGQWSGGALVIGTSYTMTLTGTYQPGGNVNFAFTLTDGTTSTTITQTLTEEQSPDGTNFGFRNRTNAATGLTASFDNFSLSQIPEPSSVGLLMISGFACFCRRRR